MSASTLLPVTPTERTPPKPQSFVKTAESGDGFRDTFEGGARAAREDTGAPRRARDEDKTSDKRDDRSPRRGVDKSVQSTTPKPQAAAASGEAANVTSGVAALVFDAPVADADGANVLTQADDTSPPVESGEEIHGDVVDVADSGDALAAAPIVDIAAALNTPIASTAPASDTNSADGEAEAASAAAASATTTATANAPSFAAADASPDADGAADARATDEAVSSDDASGVDAASTPTSDTTAASLAAAVGVAQTTAAPTEDAPTDTLAQAAKATADGRGKAGQKRAVALDDVRPRAIHTDDAQESDDKSRAAPSERAARDGAAPAFAAKIEKAKIDGVDKDQASGASPQVLSLETPTHRASEVSAAKVAAQASAAQTPPPAAQIVAAIRADSHSKDIDVRLDPPELGRVHISLSFDKGDAVSATVSSERSDTLDLLRRHQEDLSRELQKAGFVRVKLDFSSSSSGQNFSARAEPQTPPRQAALANTDAAEEPRVHYLSLRIDNRLDRLV